MKALFLSVVWIFCEPSLPQCPVEEGRSELCCAKRYPCLESPEPMREFAAAAESGSAKHAYALALHFLIDRSDDVAARKWIELAASQNFHTAKIDLALLRLKLDLAEPSRSESLEAQIEDLEIQIAGNPFLETRLGWILLGSESHERLALRVLENAASHGSTAALETILTRAFSDAPPATLALWCAVADRTGVFGASAVFRNCHASYLEDTEEFLRNVDDQSVLFTGNLGKIERKVQECRGEAIGGSSSARGFDSKPQHAD